MRRNQPLCLVTAGVLTAVCVTPVAIAAQKPPVGSIVRVLAPMADGRTSRELASGRLVSLESDTVVIDRGAWHDRVALDSGRTLEVRIRRKRNAGTGALIGLVSGGVVTMALPCDGEDGMFPCSSVRAAGLLVLGGGGAALGAILGLLVRSNDWQTLSRARVSVLPESPTRVAVNVRLRL